MKLFIALAFLAVASARPDIMPIELPAPAPPTVAAAEEKAAPVAAEVSATPVKVVDTPTPQAITENVDIPSPVKVVDAPAVESTAESIKIVDAPTPEAPAEPIEVVAPALNPTVPLDQVVNTAAVEIAANTVKVVEFPNLDAPAEVSEGSNLEAEVTPVKFVDAPDQIPEVQPSQAEVAVEIAEPLAVRVINSPINEDVEAIHMMIPDPLSMIDISPALVSPDLMRRVAEMAENEAVNFGAVGPFAVHDSEPLDSIERVKVVDAPINVLDAQMSPVIIVDSSAQQQPSFDNSETVRVVDLPQLPALDIPMVNWRGPNLEAQRPAPPMFREVPREWLLRDRPPFNMPPIYNNPMWR